MQLVRRSPPENDTVTVVRIQPQRAPIKWSSDSSREDFENDYPSIGQFLVDLFKGEIKGFIRPRFVE